MLINVLVAYGVIVAQLVNGRLPAAFRASVITAFMHSSDALISRVVLLSQDLKTAHSGYYKDLLLSELSSRAFSQSGNNFSPVMMLLASVSEKQRTNISTDHSGMAPKSAF